MSFFASAYRRMRALDLDEIFSYQTTKEVRMIDFRLGAVCNCIRLIVLGYVIGYVFIYKEGYTVAEKSVGWTVVDVSGSTYSKTSTGYQPWDAVDAVTPALEDGAAFVATKIAVTPGQTIQDKPDKNQPCSDASTCPRQPPDNVGICASNQFCQVNGWHPVYSPQDCDTSLVNKKFFATCCVIVEAPSNLFPLKILLIFFITALVIPFASTPG